MTARRYKFVSYAPMTKCLESIKSMEGNKTPGMDGLPVEFNKVFWKDVGELLV